MAKVDGVWDTVTKTPMGDQAAEVTITSSGDTFTGVSKGALGSMELLDGKIDGDKVTWRMEMTVPFPISLEAEALIAGDQLAGSIKAGAFGASPITGTRRT